MLVLTNAFLICVKFCCRAIAQNDSILYPLVLYLPPMPVQAFSNVENGERVLARDLCPFSPAYRSRQSFTRHSAALSSSCSYTRSFREFRVYSTKFNPSSIDFPIYALIRSLHESDAVWPFVTLSV